MWYSNLSSELVPNVIDVCFDAEGHDFDQDDSEGDSADETEEEGEEAELLQDPELEIAVEIESDGEEGEGSGEEDPEAESGEDGEGDGLEELDDLGEEEDEEIDDEEASMEEGDEDDEGANQAWPGSHSRGRTARRGIAEGSEHEGEGDDEDDDGDDDDQDEDVEMGEDGPDGMGHLDYGQEEDGEGDYEDYTAQVNEDDEEGGDQGDHDDDGAGMAEEDHFWNGGGNIGRVPAPARFRLGDDGDGDDDFVARPRTDRSRRLSQSQGSQHHAGMALSTIIDNIRNQQGSSGSGVFTIPSGSMLTGGVLQTDDGQGGGEMIHFDQSGGMTARRFFMRAPAGASLSDVLDGGAGGDIGANISALLSNILPPNVSMTSSTARVDPRTGALTFSINGTRTDHPTQSQAPTVLGATAVQPPAHPLLTVTDPRRSRFLQPCVNGLANNTVSRGVMNRASPSMLSALGITATSNFDASTRRGQVSARRREVGPIVSDRRWGTDIGDLEPAGARLSALTSAVETALGDAIHREPPPEPRPRTASLGGGKGSRDPLFGFFPLSGKEERASPPALGGTRYESDEDEDGDDAEEDDEDDGEGDSDSDGEGSDDAEVRASARRSRLLGYDPNETKEEEGELQETKEGEPSSSSSATAAVQAVQGSTVGSSAAARVADASPADVPVASSTAMEVDSATAADAVAVAAAPPAEAASGEASAAMEATQPAVSASATAPAAAEVDSTINTDNLAFVESLEPELREEVLLSAELDFLASLPRAMQDEARALRRANGVIDQELPAVSVPVTAVAAAPDAPAVAALDFNSLLQQTSSTGAASTGAAAPTTAASSGPASNSSATAAPAAGSGSGVGATANEMAVLLRNLVSGSGAAAGAAGAASAAASAAPAVTAAPARTPAIGGSATGVEVPAPAASTPAVAVPAQPTLEERRAAELPLTVSLGEDRLEPVLPYGAHLVARLLRSFLMSNKSKLPRSVSKLLATACRYKRGRQWIIRALFGSLTHHGKRVAECVENIPLEAESSATAFRAELDQLESVVDHTEHTAVNIHRIISGMSFLYRRTDRLAWYDIMLYPLPEEDSVWLFGSLISLLGDAVHATGENLEYLLQVMEELCGVFSKLTVKQANELAADAQRRLAIVRQQNRKSGRTVTYAAVGAPLETIDEEDAEDLDLPKRRRLEPPTPDASGSAGSVEGARAAVSPPTRARTASIDIVSEPAGNGAAAGKDGAEEPLLSKDRHRMPFPVLDDSQAKLLCQVAGSVDCSGNARKRLMRVMRYLSLCDNNWMLFLDHLANVGADLAGRATREFSDLRETLVEVVQSNETAAAAMARPELSTPKGMCEVRLLSVLRIMTALRSRSTESAAAEAEVVASRVRRIPASSLWESLCDCLDIVRDLEGIKDTSDEVERAEQGSSSSSGGKKKNKEEEKEVTLSSLTLRFMPLIECFLSVCATTMLVRPDKIGTSAFHETQRELERLSSGFKRRHSRDDSHPPIADLSQPVTGPGGIPRYSPSTPSGAPATDLTSPSTINRVNSMLPGSRFRQHASYFQMQMELNDDAAAERLITFVTQNRVLFNNVLRTNVSLLETSFSPLVSVPRCRQLLHFDIKRAYFRLKLKRMRQSSNRSHGTLRLAVHRTGVFEESFQALRYKTADEMRRRLSVTFHGEEGMDAGGLTREWYGVLAREIFNPNYALFTSAGDNVTFQPNAQSYINPDHQAYFKFVGRVIGKAICDGQLLDAHFTRSFYKHILGLPVSVVDLEAIDPEYFKSLKQILETPLDLLGLDLTFSAESNDFGVVSTVDLIPQGQDVPVTDDTKHEYVKLLAHHRMTTAIRKQVHSTTFVPLLSAPYTL